MGPKLQILHGGEERLGLHLNSFREHPSGARPEDAHQAILNLALLTKPHNVGDPSSADDAPFVAYLNLGIDVSRLG